MESCFPPLAAALSLRSSSNSKSQRNRHNSGGPIPNDIYSVGDTKNADDQEFNAKLEVLQDLDLYYIRQIASSLKVSLIRIYGILY